MSLWKLGVRRRSLWEYVLSDKKHSRPVGMASQPGKNVVTTLVATTMLFSVSRTYVANVFIWSLLPAGRLVVVSILPSAGSLLLK